MDRLERLVNLVAALLDAERPLSREQIRQRVAGYAGEGEAFRRTFERDKDLLRQMGLPLLLEPLDPGRPDGPTGYRIPPERYALPDPGLAEDELAALRLAAGAVRMEGAWGQSAATSALWKLAGATAGSGTPAPTPPTTALAELPAGDNLAVLFGAVADRQPVGFDYRGERRLVDPWRLSFRNGQWYLSGWDHDRRAERLFRLDRVGGAVEAAGGPGSFARPAVTSSGPPAPWRLGDDEETVVEVLVDAEQAEWAATAVGEGDELERRNDGSVLLRLRVTNHSALRSFVLGFLEHAEILGPASVHGQFVAWLDAVACSPVPAPPAGTQL